MVRAAVIFFGLLSPAFSPAETGWYTTDGSKMQVPAGGLSFFSDPDDRFNVPGEMAGRRIRYLPAGRSTGLLPADAPVWIRLRVINPSDKTERMILRFNQPMIDRATLFHGDQPAGVTGVLIPRHERQEKGGTPSLRLNLKPGKNEILIKTESRARDPGITLFKPQALRDYNQAREKFISALGGALLMCFIYTLVTGVIRRNRNYYILALCIFLVALERFAASGLAPGGIFAATFHPVFAHLCVIATCFLLLRMFQAGRLLPGKKGNPVRLLVALNVLSLVITVPLAKTAVSYYVVLFWAAAVAALFVFVAGLYGRASLPGSRAYPAAVLLLLAGILVQGTDYFIHIGGPSWRGLYLEVFAVLSCLWFFVAGEKTAQMALAGTEAERRKTDFHRNQYLRESVRKLTAPLRALRAVTYNNISDPDTREQISEKIRAMENTASDLAVLPSMDTRAGNDPTTFIIDDLISEVELSCREVASHESGVAVRKKSSRDHRETFSCDRQKAAAVISELIKNACIHGRNPDYEYSVVTWDVMLKGDKLWISVNDNGRKIPEKDAERIWEPFFRGENAGGSGSGMGLTIAKTFASIMDAELNIFPEKGGTRAEFVIPRSSAAPSPVAPEAEDKPGHGYRVLYMENLNERIRIHEPMLRGAGYEVIIVSDAASACKELSGTEYDLLIFDEGRYGRSGEDLMRKARTISRNPAIKRAALSSSKGFQDNYSRILESGADVALEVPVLSEEDFLRQIRATLSAAEDERKNIGESIERGVAEKLMAFEKKLRGPVSQLGALIGHLEEARGSEDQAARLKEMATDIRSNIRSISASAMGGPPLKKSGITVFDAEEVLLRSLAVLGRVRPWSGVRIRYKLSHDEKSLRSDFAVCSEVFRRLLDAATDNADDEKLTIESRPTGDGRIMFTISFRDTMADPPEGGGDGTMLLRYFDEQETAELKSMVSGLGGSVRFEVSERITSFIFDIECSGLPASETWQLPTGLQSAVKQAGALSADIPYVAVISGSSHVRKYWSCLEGSFKAEIYRSVAEFFRRKGPGAAALIVADYENCTEGALLKGLEQRGHGTPVVVTGHHGETPEGCILAHTDEIPGSGKQVEDWIGLAAATDSKTVA